MGYVTFCKIKIIPLTSSMFGKYMEHFPLMVPCDPQPRLRNPLPHIHRQRVRWFYPKQIHWVTTSLVTSVPNCQSHLFIRLFLSWDPVATIVLVDGESTAVGAPFSHLLLCNYCNSRPWIYHQRVRSTCCHKQESCALIKQNIFKTNWKKPAHG